MIIVKSPLRVSFFGGGTDVPSYYESYNGCVLSCSINKYTYISIKDNKINNNTILSYSKREIIINNDKIKHPVFRDLLKYHELSNVEIHTISDLPAGLGLASSSSFTAALIKSINEFNSQKLSKKNLVFDTINCERKRLKESGGYQDQIATVYGGINFIEFSKKYTFKVNQLKIVNKIIRSLEDSCFLLFFNRKKHSSKLSFARTILKSEQIMLLHELKKHAKIAKQLILDHKLIDFGRLLDETWRVKSSLVENNYEINSIYNMFKKNRIILGGKVLGAGGGGSLLLYCDSEKIGNFHKLCKKMKLNPVKFNIVDKGTQIIYNSIK